MIRITVERIEYQTKTDDGSMGMIVDYEPLEECHERRRELLRQEMDEGKFDLAAIICVLNNLEPEPLCKCGHPSEMHPGGARCGHTSDRGIGYSDRQCDCLSYRSLHMERMRKLESDHLDVLKDRDEAHGKNDAMQMVLRTRQSEIVNQRAHLDRLRTTVARLRERNRHG